MAQLISMRRFCAKLAKNHALKHDGAPVRDPARWKAQSEGYVPQRRPTLHRDDATLPRYPAYEQATDEPLREPFNSAAFRRQLESFRIGMIDASARDFGGSEPPHRQSLETCTRVGERLSLEPVATDERSAQLQETLTRAVKRLGDKAGRPRR